MAVEILGGVFLKLSGSVRGDDPAGGKKGVGLSGGGEGLSLS